METAKSDIVFPRPLQEGDCVAILSPASRIEDEYVAKTAEALRRQGWEPVVMPHALGSAGSYSGTLEERAWDLEAAFAEEKIRAIICSRGGYGTVHLLERLERLPLKEDPKWVAGFSDISVLHALMCSFGIASLHCPMAKQLAMGAGHGVNDAVFGILRGELPSHTFPGHPYDHAGEACGTLFGGNVAVLAGLIGSRFDQLKGDRILFLEDVGEPIYKIERALYQLKLSGVLPSLRGLVVGQFTEYRPDDDHPDMESMIRDMVAAYGYPVAFNAPIGHVEGNLPLIEGARVCLKTDKGETSLTFLP